MIKPYRGAAILFWKKVDGKVFVLLGKRTIKVGYGKWSTFGGGYNNDGSCLKNAEREASEETNQCTDWEKFFGSEENKSCFHVNQKSIRHVRLPFYWYETYACQVTGDEMDHAWWGNEDGTANNTEVSEWKWFETTKLPKDTYILARWVVFDLLLRGRIKKGL